MKEELVKDVAVSPADVRTYFKDLPADSIPFVPTEVEVEILTRQPKIELRKLTVWRDELRSYTDRVNKGETTFATLARLYSEDPGSARQGGELGYTGRGMLDPAFANVAFNLTDPKKNFQDCGDRIRSHIIQLIDKRGDKVNVRHILLKPHVSQDAIEKAKLRLDSISNDIRAAKFTFEDAASYISDDKDTKIIMVWWRTRIRVRARTSKFKMGSPQRLPVVDTLKVNEISAPFQMVNETMKKRSGRSRKKISMTKETGTVG